MRLMNDETPPSRCGLIAEQFIKRNCLHDARTNSAIDIKALCLDFE